MHDSHDWWQRGILYQIYPRSFADASADGVGDLAGITGKLAYLARLGVDAIWISPIYPSPMADFGYDIADYTAVHPLFGSLQDFDRLLAEAHRQGLRVILDFVPNHTSDQHPWFLESRSSRTSAKRDWYIWSDPAADGGPPNNWLSNFGGSAWQWDAATGQYYYHAYLSEQPDLNWRNPEVQAALLQVLHFWLERGVDGFRIDALRQLIKDEQLRDNPPNPDYRPWQRPYEQLLPLYTTDQPEVLEMLALMRGAVDAYDDRILIGELYLSIERLVAYYGDDDCPGCHLPFNFHLIHTAWEAEMLAALIDTYEAALPAHGWPNWVLGNHDRSRIASRVGAAQARVAAVLLLTLRGTPTLYYGDEIGMHDVPVPPHLVQDPLEKNVPGLGLGRDPARTPMQWSSDVHAGFGSATPWLPLAEDYRSCNVERQERDPASMLALYRRLIALRRAEPALAIGGYRPAGVDGAALAYVREWQGRRFLVVLNLGAQQVRFTPTVPALRGVVVLSTHAESEGRQVDESLSLAPNEALIARLEER